MIRRTWMPIIAAIGIWAASPVAAAPWGAGVAPALGALSGERLTTDVQYVVRRRVVRHRVVRPRRVVYRTVVYRPVRVVRRPVVCRTVMARRWSPTYQAMIVRPVRVCR